MRAVTSSVESPLAHDPHPLLRITVLLPYVLVLGHALMSTARLPFLPMLPYVVLAVLLAVLGAVAANRTQPGRFGWSPRDAWVVLSALGGTALLAPTLGGLLEVNVPAFGAVIGLMLLNMAALLRSWLRFVAGGWSVVVWGVALWWSGEPVSVVVAAVLAAAAVFGVGVAVADLLLRALERERLARREAESYTRLLEGLHGLRSLDMVEVASAAADAVHHRGYRGAAVRLLDRQHGEAPCLAVAGEVDPAPRSLRSGALTGLDTSDRVVTHTDPDGVQVRFLPLERGREIVGALEVRGDPPSGMSGDAQVLTSIARRAEAAMARARAYELDRHDIRELALLEHQTSDLVSTVSHELRTPTTVINGLAETLAEHWSDLSDEVRSTLLGRVDASAVRLDTIVGSLLDTGALEHGRLAPEPREVALGPVIAAVVDRLELVTTEHRIRTELAPDVRARIDVALFEHVLENLLVNVAHHTPPGTEAVVAVRSSPEEGVVLTVTDDGPGIDEGDVVNVFDRFFRGGDPDRRTSGGLGLGLSLAQQIVDAHGGELTVARVAARGGTCFTIRLPAVGAGPNAPDGMPV